MKYNNIGLILFVIVCNLFANENLELRVGCYDNKPKIYYDNGAVEGFWADITNDLAEENDWNITWVYGSWHQCLYKLEHNEIDLMIDLGLTKEREQLFNIIDEPLQISWTRIYRNVDSNIESILDLENKTIAGLRGSFDLDGPEGLKALTKKFNIECTILEFSSYEEIFKKLDLKKIDAAIVDKDFANINEFRFNIQETSIILQPAKMCYALSKDSPLFTKMNPIITNYIKKIKNDQNSIYYKSIDKHLTHNMYKGEKHSILIIFFIMGSLIVVIVLFFDRRLLKKISKIKKESKRIISEKLEVKIKLNESEYRYKSIIEQSGDSILIMDHDGNLVDFNKEAMILTGCTKDELYTMNINDVFKSKQIKENSLKTDILSSDKSHLNERILSTKDDKEIYVEMNSKLLLDGKILTNIRDLTSRKKNEKIIIESENKLRALFSAMDLLILELDSDGIYLDIAPTALNLLYKNHSRIIGKPLSEVLPKKVADLCMSAINITIKERLKHSIEYDLLVGDELIHFKATFSPKENNTVIAIIEDITNQHNISEELKNYRDHLEELVKQRTIALEEKNEELNKINEIFVGREFRIKSLKDKIKELNTKD